MKFSYGISSMLLLIIFINIVDCFKCYVCHSLIQPRCDSDLDEEFLMECANTSKLNPIENMNEQKKLKTEHLNSSLVASHCRKTTQYLYFKDPAEYHTIRECVFFPPVHIKCRKKYWRELVIRTCTCDTEGCNHTPHRLGSTWTHLVIVVLAALIPP